MEALERRIEAQVGVDASEQQRRRALVGLAFSAALSLALPAISIATDAHALCAVACFPAIGLLTSLGMLGMAAAPGRAVLAPGVVEIDDGHLVLRSHDNRLQQRVPLSQIAQGHRELPDLVHLATRDGETLVVQPSASPDATCEHLLRACGVTAAERVLAVPLPSPASRVLGGRFFVGTVLALLFLLTGLVTLGFGVGVRQVALGSTGAISLLLIALVVFAVLGAAGYFLVRALGRRMALVGADGVVFRGALRTRRVPYREVTEVTPDRRGVRVHRNNGKSLLIPTSGREVMPLLPRPVRDAPLPDGEAIREVLLERIGEAREAWERGAYERPGLDALDRQGRTVDAWRQDLAKILVADGTYRRAGLSSADLGGVIEDAAAPSERRIAAAVALSASEPDEARRRVRVAADACADDDLRRAIERAGEGEIDAAIAEREAAKRR